MNKDVFDGMIVEFDQQVYVKFMYPHSVRDYVMHQKIRNRASKIAQSFIPEIKRKIEEIIREEFADYDE